MISLFFSFLISSSLAQTRLAPPVIQPVPGFDFINSRLSDDLELKQVHEALDPYLLAQSKIKRKRVEVTLHYTFINDSKTARAEVISPYLVFEGEPERGRTTAEVTGTFDVRGKSHSSVDISLGLSEGKADLEAPEAHHELPAIHFKPPRKPGEVLAMPVLTREQLNVIFDPNRKVRFSLIWNGNTYDPRALKSGRETSSLFVKLARHKLFALAFADFYAIHRDELDRIASQHSKPDEAFLIKIYFQRYKKDLDAFGEAGTAADEEGVVNAYHRLEDITRLKVAPKIRMVLERIKTDPIRGDTVLSSTLIFEDEEVYGPGTDRTLLVLEQLESILNLIEL